MLQLTFNPGLTLTGFRTTRPCTLSLLSFSLIFTGRGGGGRKNKILFMLRKPKEDTESLEKLSLWRLCFQGQIPDKYTLQDKGCICLDCKNIQGCLSGTNELLKGETHVWSVCNRPFARSGNMVQSHTCWWASGLVRVALFWKSHCATCSPACVILYHVTRSCKGPTESPKPLLF